MNEPNTEVTKQCIEASNQLIADAKNEQVIRDSFTSYLRTIFPDVPSWVERHVRGGEAAVKISKGTRVSTGFVDNLVDLTAIEYESNLNITGKFNTGYNQVKDYCAALLNQGNSPDLVLGVLSDTVRWYSYRVIIPEEVSPPYTRDNIELEEIEFIDVSLADGISVQNLIRFLIRYLGRLGARPITAKSIADDLGFNSSFCSSHIEALKKLVLKGFEDNPKYAELIQRLWCSFVSYLRENGHSDSFDNKTYVDEFYILILGKLICANFIEREALLSNGHDIKGILKGDFFENRGILNLVEYDYFGWLNSSPYIEELVPVAKSIQYDLRAYNFKEEPREDLFGRLMAQLANRSQRLLLGQEWTPSWLSQKLVSNVISNLPEKEPLRLLDMCCGSGSIIVETIKIAKERIAENHPDISPDENIKFLSQSITGFDIDPLAVILSKISWILTSLDWINEYQGQSIYIPIYHADSLFAITPLSENLDEEDEGEYYKLKVAEYIIELPKLLISPSLQQFFDSLIDRAYRIVNSAKNLPALIVSGEDISATIDDIFHLSNGEINDENRSSVEAFFKEFIEKVDLLDRDGRNGIWASILRNSYRPGLVTGQFNGLVSNPPWMALSKVANNPYQVVLKKKAEAYGIKPEGSSHLHIELATIFLLHSIENYLCDNAIFGCVTPETLLNGHHHNPFRRGDYLTANKPVSFSIEEVWRIRKGVFKNEAIIVFGEKTDTPENPNPIPSKFVDEETSINESLYKHQQGNRTAWSTKEPKNDIEDMAVYATGELFRQGADIMPRTLFFYEVKRVNDRLSYIKSIDPVSSPIAFTVKAAKKNQDFNLSPRNFLNEFIFDVITSNLLTPFHLAVAQKVILPLRKDVSNVWEMVSTTQIAMKGVIVQNTFNSIANAIETNGTIESIFNLVNTLGKLTQQIISDEGFIVLTGAGGGKVCSSYISQENITVKKLILDQTVYWAQVATENEAIYLSGLLNSEAVNELIADFQPKGSFGKRHVHKLPFGVTPPYDSEQPAHQDVIEKTRILLSDYSALIDTNEDLQNHLNPNSSSLARRRRKIITHLKTLSSYNDYENACREVYGL